MRSRRASHSRGLIAAVVDEAARRLIDDVQAEVSMDINRLRGFMKTRDVKTLYRLEQSLSKAKDDLVELRYMITSGAPA